MVHLRYSFISERRQGIRRNFFYSFSLFVFLTSRLDREEIRKTCDVEYFYDIAARAGDLHRSPGIHSFLS